MTIIAALQHPNNIFSKEFLLGWLKEHGVLDIIWDPKKTHLELVKRSSDIFRILAREKQLTPDLLETIKELMQSVYKAEALKFIQEAAFYLTEEQKYFIVRLVAETPGGGGVGSQQRLVGAAQVC